MKEIRTVFDLVREVACRLAGQPVIISPDPPPYKGQPGRMVSGAAYKNAQGTPVICVPADSCEESFLTFLHECAHVRLHSDVFPTLNNPQPRAIQTPATRDPGNAKRESEADILADGWMKIARRHYKEFTGTLYVSLLQAIYQFYETGDEK